MTYKGRPLMGRPFLHLLCRPAYGTWNVTINCGRAAVAAVGGDGTMSFAHQFIERVRGGYRKLLDLPAGRSVERPTDRYG